MHSAWRPHPPATCGKHLILRRPCSSWLERDNRKRTLCLAIQVFSLLCYLRGADRKQRQAMGADADVEADMARCAAYRILSIDCVDGALQEGTREDWSSFDAAALSVHPHTLWQWRFHLKVVCTACL